MSNSNDYTMKENFVHALFKNLEMAGCALGFKQYDYGYGSWLWEYGSK